MQVITQYYLKSHLHIKRIKWMLSQLAPSFPPLSLVLGAMHRNQCTVLGKSGTLTSCWKSSQRGLMDAERWELKETSAAIISGLKPPRPHLINCHLCYWMPESLTCLGSPWGKWPYLGSPPPPPPCCSQHPVHTRTLNSCIWKALVSSAGPS